MVTATFEGEVPPFAEWRGMFHSVTGKLRRAELATWVVGVPHNRAGGRGDIHMLLDLPEHTRTHLWKIGGWDETATRFNRSRSLLPQVGRSLESIFVPSGFGMVVDVRIRPIDGGASDYLLGRQWSEQIWRSGTRTGLSNGDLRQIAAFPDAHVDPRGLALSDPLDL